MINPIKKPVLRRAGQGLEEELQRVMDDEVVPRIALVLACLFVAVYSWLIYLTPLENNPLIMSGVALASLLFLVLYHRKSKQLRHNLTQGILGERAVAEHLMNNLINERCRIFNDLVFNDAFNIDHLIVSTRGIFVIETKTYTKPENDARIYVRDDGLHFPHGVKHEELEQVKRQMRFMEQWLYERMNLRVSCRGALLFPGWYVEDQRTDKKPWVLSAKPFLKWFRNESPDILSVDEFNRIKAVMHDYIVGHESLLQEMREH